MNGARELVVKYFEEAKHVLALFLGDSRNIEKVIQLAAEIHKCFGRGGKVITCGNGGSMCDAMHMAEELTGKFRDERRPLPAIAISDPSYISCAANDYGYDEVFARFVEAHGRGGDVLVAFSTSGNSPNVVKAVRRAKEKGIYTAGLTGRDGGILAREADLAIVVEGSRYADHIQEVHIKIVHAVIMAVEFLMGVSKESHAG